MSVSLLLVLLLAAVTVATHSHLCLYDAECRLSHRGVCWRRHGSTVGTCACGPDQSYRVDLGACESPEENATEVELPDLYYYDTTGASVDRYDLTPRWPEIWTCDATRCVAADDPTRAVYAVAPPSALLQAAATGGVLSPSVVGLSCAQNYRFFESAFAPSRLLNADNMPLHSSHCISCAEWCGEHGTCADERLYTCACSSGYTGRRCESSGRASVLDALAFATDFAPYIPPVYTPADAFAGILREAFPAYTTDRVCAGDEGCAAGERCWAHVATSLAHGRIARRCFCASGNVPVEGAASGCATADAVGLEPSVVFGMRLAGRDTTGLLIGNYTSDGLQFAYATLANNATVVSARSTDLTPRIRVTSRLEPIYILCSNATAQAPSLLTPSDPAGWCDNCATTCNGWGAGGGATTACDDTGCVCNATTHRGPLCATCVDASLLPPACNETAAACAARQCSAPHGECVAGGSGCACAAGWTGAACNVTAAACGELQCTEHGVCDTEGACVCNAGWAGVACDVPLSLCNLRLCNNHGTCVRGGTTCACESGNWTGHACETPRCDHGTLQLAPIVLPNGTVLVEDDDAEETAPADRLRVCVCAPGYSGPHCDAYACGTPGAGTYDADTQTCRCNGVLAGPTCAEHNCGAGYAFDAFSCVCPASHTLSYSALPHCVVPLEAITPQALDTRRSEPSVTTRSILTALPVAAVAVIAVTLRLRSSE